MDTLKIRVKVGTHEFEAEGPRESVELQFSIFKDLVEAIPAVTKKSPEAHGEKPDDSLNGPAGADIERSTYSALFSADADRLSLHYLPAEGSERDVSAVLLLLLGHRVILSQESVLGGRLMQGLQQSGLALDRIDRVMDPYLGNLVLKNGIKKGTKYRLTNAGMARAKTLAEEQLKILG